jgi:hypothetical protein
MKVEIYNRMYNWMKKYYPSKITILNNLSLTDKLFMIKKYWDIKYNEKDCEFIDFGYDFSNEKTISIENISGNILFYMKDKYNNKRKTFIYNIGFNE